MIWDIRNVKKNELCKRISRIQYTLNLMGASLDWSRLTFTLDEKEILQ